MIIYVKFATSYYPSNYVTEFVNEFKDGFQELEISSMDSFKQSQNQILADFFESLKPVIELEE